MGNAERIRAAIAATLSAQADPGKTRTEDQRAAKKARTPELDLADGTAATRTLGDPLGRLMPVLIEQGVQLLQENAAVDVEQAGAVLRGLERFDAPDSQWDETVEALFRAALISLNCGPSMSAGDPVFVQLTEAVVGGVASEMKSRLADQKAPRPDERLSARLTQLIGVLLQYGGRAVSESTSLRTMPPARCLELAQHLSGSVCALTLDSSDSTVAAILTTSPWLDRLVESLWRVVAEFPSAFADSGSVNWWRDVLAELARPRRDETNYEADLVAEALLLIVERGAIDFAGLARNPSNKQLYLTTAFRALLEVLTESIGEESKYRLGDRLRRSELYEVMQAVMGSWMERPEWLFRKPARQERAATLLPVLVEGLAEPDEGTLKGLLRHGHLQRVLSSALLSGLSSKLSSLSSRRVASLLNPVMTEFALVGYASWSVLLEQDRLTDLLSAISKSKIEEKLFSEDAEEVRAAGRSIAMVALELRAGRSMSLTELVERLNKAK